MSEEMDQLEALSGKDRARAIMAVVRDLVHEQQRITTAAIDSRCLLLPHWSECGEDEATAALAVIEAEASAHVAKLEAEAAPTDQPEALSPDNTYSEPAPAEQPQPIDRDAVLSAMNESIRLREAARASYNFAIRKRQELRGKLADLLAEWQTGLPKMTREQAAREVMAATRATRAQNRQLGGVPGPSRHDQERFWRTHGDTTGYGFLRKQVGRGNRRFRSGDVMLPDGRIVVAPKG
jgi:hypothetical protein